MSSPAPTYDAALILVSMEIVHALNSRSMFVTWACQQTDITMDAQDMADEQASIFQGSWGVRFDADTLLGPATVLLGDGTDTPSFATSAAAPTAGTNSTSTLPPNCAVLVRKNTGLGGRKNRGRVYLPHVIAEASVDEAGKFSGATLTNLQSSATDWLGDLVTADMPMHICNRERSTNPTPPPADYVSNYALGAGVTSLTVDPMIASQRLRLGR